MRALEQTIAGLLSISADWEWIDNVAHWGELLSIVEDVCVLATLQEKCYIITNTSVTDII